MVLFLRGQQWRIKWGKIFDGLVTMWEKMEAKFLKFKMFHIFWQWKASAALSFSLCLSLSLTHYRSLSLTHTTSHSIYLSLTHTFLAPIPQYPSVFHKTALSLRITLYTHTHTHTLSLSLSFFPLSLSLDHTDSSESWQLVETWRIQRF